MNFKSIPPENIFGSFEVMIKAVGPEWFSTISRQEVISATVFNVNVRGMYIVKIPEDA
jgi:hypothetical protein